MLDNSSRYNVIVKQVEGAADHLRQCAEKVDAFAKADPIGAKLQKHLLIAAKRLDRRAIRMLAYYDGVAKQMLVDGVGYDPRRDLFKPDPKTGKVRSVLDVVASAFGLKTDLVPPSAAVVDPRSRIASCAVTLFLSLLRIRFLARS